MLNLEKAVEVALAGNPDVKIARARVEEARGAYQRAKSGLGIKFNLAGSYTRLDPANEARFQMDPSQPARTIKLTDENNFGVRAVLEKIITTFGQLEYAVAAAALQVGAWEGNYEATRQNVILSTKEGYLQALRSSGLADVAGEKLKVVEQQLRITNDLFKAGVIPRYEVLRNELVLSQARQMLIIARNREKLAMASFLNVLGLDRNAPVCLDKEGEVVIIKADMEKAQAMAIENRPEIKALLLSRQALAYMLESAKRGHNPILSFTSTVENKTISGFNANPTTWSNMFVLAIPLSDGGNTAGKIREASSQLEQLEQNIAKLYLGFQLEVEQAILTLKEVEARLDSARKDVATSQEGYAIALTRYQNGLSTIVELDDALTVLYESKTNLLLTEYEYKISVARLERATAANWRGESKDAKAVK
jgi:outer membrane protein TolC